MLLLLLLVALSAQHQWQKATSQPCDMTLWGHVYHPDRLLVKSACVTVTGMIVDATHGKRKSGARKEQDGDCHAWLKLDDPGQEQYLNEGNKKSEGGNLVFEIVCMYPVKQKDAIEACKGYTNKVKLLPIGSHVQLTGSWVQETNHDRWMEIHPVSSITLIGAARAD